MVRGNDTQDILRYRWKCFVCAAVDCFALFCPKNFSVQSDPALFCASVNKRLELELHIGSCGIRLTTSRFG